MLIPIIKTSLFDTYLLVPKNHIELFVKKFIFQPYENTVLHVIGVWKLDEYCKTWLYVNVKEQTAHNNMRGMNYFFKSQPVTPELILDNLNLYKPYEFILCNGENVVHITEVLQNNLKYIEIGKFDMTSDNLNIIFDT